MFRFAIHGARSRLMLGLVSVPFLSILAACGGATAAGTGAASATTPATTVPIARPSNPGGPGQAASMTGDPQRGMGIFASNCQACHGAQGTAGVSNPGSTDGTVPALNPIDATLQSKDPKVFAYNVDLFIQHGSTPGGATPALKMAAWGDTNTLTQQQIADVIAYIISINPAK
ncbi:MAG: cytochrome c [Herpetosiphonaceae bacterium]|nr:cytochrome c [Gammaproteobacteria bacterium]MBA3945936.1 cytochrome c [Herpetosiphonaceae bacterium]